MPLKPHFEQTFVQDTMHTYIVNAAPKSSAVSLKYFIVLQAFNDAVQKPINNIIFMFLVS